MANWDDIILQLANGQQALHNTLQQYIRQEGPLVLKRLSWRPNFTTGCHRSFMNGG